MDAELKTYRVAWYIDIDAESPREAALEALEIQRDLDSAALVFMVDGAAIDLSEVKDAISDR